MSRHKLSWHIRKGITDWNKDRKRTSWLFCPICKHDVNGDDKSFIEDKGGYWWFKCSNCGCKSKWGFHMMPYPVAFQQLTTKLLPTPVEGSE